jgi:alpha/beta superfamily hydrolase
MEPVTFSTDDGVRLEGELRMPDDAPRGSAVICHPHPKHGGSKDHPLLWAIRNDLAGTRGLAVLGFNFRGVMGSGGTYGGGRDELRDAAAAIATARTHAPEGAPTVLVGWSFGASVALRAVIDDRTVAALALVGLPLAPHDLALPPLPEAAELRLVRCPTLLLAGVHDPYCPAETLRSYGASIPDGRVTVVEGTDHYFWRREREAAETIGTFVDEILSPESG